MYGQSLLATDMPRLVASSCRIYANIALALLAAGAAMVDTTEAAAGSVRRLNTFVDFKSRFNKMPPVALDDGNEGDEGNEGNEGFDFFTPGGNDGDEGDEGDEGNEGDEGEEGDEGDEGNEGDEGDEGNEGQAGAHPTLPPAGGPLLVPVMLSGVPRSSALAFLPDHSVVIGRLTSPIKCMQASTVACGTRTGR
jgi:hypothetical protein